MRGGVEHAEALLAGMPVHHPSLQVTVDPLVIPLEERQKLLQRTNPHARRQRDRLDALALQAGQQALDVYLQISVCILTLEIGPKRLEQRSQLRLQGSNLIRIH